MAWDIVQGGLFNAPGSNDDTSEFSWLDFLAVMKSLGFKTKKMFGSVWQFEPGEKAVATGLERPINFQRSHGRGCLSACISVYERG